MKNVLKALLKAKKEINPIVKKSENPFFKSKYSDINDLLAEVEPILHKHGLLLVQPVIKGKVTTQVWHVESGEMIGSEMELPNITDPQKIGSAVTYFRRHTLVTILSLQSLDDDGEQMREDLERLRQRAADLLDTSVWADDTGSYRELSARIDSYSHTDLKRAIAELLENQKEATRKGAKEINKAVTDRIKRDK